MEKMENVICCVISVKKLAEKSCGNVQSKPTKMRHIPVAQSKLTLIKHPELKPGDALYAYRPLCPVYLVYMLPYFVIKVIVI